MNTFPKLRFAGTPEQIGTGIGRALGPKIEKVINLYWRLIAEGFGVDRTLHRFAEEMERRSRQYQTLIRARIPRLADEIEAIAHAAKLPPWKLYFINARTEILCEGWYGEKLAPGPGECTLFAHPAAGLLGQSWDWHPELEELITILDLEPSGCPRSIFMSEPGIIGKIGVNECNVGVLLAILFGKIEGEIGIPVHLLLRQVLESESLATAMAVIQSNPINTFSTLAILDNSPNYRMLEIQRGLVHSVPDVIHTNHYVGLPESNPLATSVERKILASYIQPSIRDVATMKEAATNGDGPGQPICRTYGPGFRFPVGTVASIVIDLATRKRPVFHIVRSPADKPSVWTEHTLN